ncbi:MAG: hypothetical protein CMM94_07660 [Rickettsiales bacterium]|mgnify:CR=1 FL=1|nr:hypothetical protein [Rickettsiales bacterium]|tara:strand:+ start:412 stop:792 length:381 start_codon:yes stop_codon:yes gene_type:complete
MSEKPTGTIGSWVDGTLSQMKRDAGAVKRSFTHNFDGVGESFQFCLDNKKHGLLAAKVAGCGIGAVLTGHGVYNLIQGAGEKVQHPVDDNKLTLNHTRMFVGGFELLAGAGLLYISLTKPAEVMRS